MAVVAAAAQISEAALQPVLEAMLQQFPFCIRGFHSDNNSGFINHTVALLNKLLVERTKFRQRHSNDNTLAESKNGAVVVSAGLRQTQFRRDAILHPCQAPVLTTADTNARTGGEEVIRPSRGGRVQEPLVR